jgi:hypothetical protein
MGAERRKSGEFTAQISGFSQMLNSATHTGSILEWISG